MKLEMEVCRSLCETKIFKINNIEADYEDFGEKFDRAQNEAEDYGCGNMQFTGNKATQKTLNKYKININEYNKIVETLEEKLSFGSCGLCD